MPGNAFYNIKYGLQDPKTYDVNMGSEALNERFVNFTGIHNANDDILGVDGFIDILKNLDYPHEPLNIAALEEALLKFSNDIRLKDEITILEVRFAL